MSRRRRVAAGLTCAAAGATALVWGLAGPASAHGKQEPEEPVHGDKSCVELAEQFGVDQDWSEFAADLDGDGTQTFVIDDRGTEDESDDAAVTVTVSEGGAFLAWESTIGIDAVLVKGSNDEFGSFFYLYAAGADDEEETSDSNLGVPPWGKPYKNAIVGVSFCYDDEFTPPTVPTSETTVTSAPQEAPTVPSTEAPTTTAPQQLPETGSTTGPMVAAGAGLLAVGVALVTGKKYLQSRSS
ncbi:MAG TPA: LPXTG cell wall anchor domain-containing protein [Acidimicrobiales bacterium]